MNWTFALVFLVAAIAGTNVTKEQLRSVSPTVAYNAAMGVAYGMSDILNRVRFR